MNLKLNILIFDASVITDHCTSFEKNEFEIYGVNLFTILNRNDNLYLKVADLVMYLALLQQNALIRPIKCM